MIQNSIRVPTRTQLKKGSSFDDVFITRRWAIFSHQDRCCFKGQVVLLCHQHLKLLLKDREYKDEVKKIYSSIINLGLAIWIGAYVFHTCFSYTAQRHAYRVRVCFLKSILRQDLAWHDKNKSKDFAAKLTV